MILSIIDQLNEWMEPVDANHNNPILWIGFLVIGIAVFFLTYNALNKHQ